MKAFHVLFWLLVHTCVITARAFFTATTSPHLTSHQKPLIQVPGQNKLKVLKKQTIVSDRIKKMMTWSSLGGVDARHIRDKKQQDDEHRDPFPKKLKSLASSYLVDISFDATSQGSETWSLIPIEQADGVKSEMAVGAKAVAALQSDGMMAKTTPNRSYVELKCKRSEDKGSSALQVTMSQSTQGEEMDNSLLSVLARVMAQHYVTAVSQVPKTQQCPWTLHLLEEEPVTIENIDTESGVLELFAPLMSDENVEVVEMVLHTGLGLGMVPRPLVHKYNLLHRGIGMVVTKDVPIVSPDIHGTNKAYPDLYCHRRTETKRIFPSLYDMFVGGVSLANEDPCATASREVAEELGLTRALSEDNPLSQPLFDCTVCTSYNRCVVTVFCYPMDSKRESTWWQEEEVAWGDFVPYSIVEAAAELSIQRMVSSQTWPGSDPPNMPRSQKPKVSYEKYDWTAWDFVPDGLLVWEAWLHWQKQSA